MKTKENKTKFLASPFFMIIAIFFIMSGYTSYVLFFHVLPKEIINGEPLFTRNMIMVFSLAGSTVILLLLFNRCFSIIEIDEQGVHKSLFKKYFRIDIAWNEIKDLRKSDSAIKWLFISKKNMVGKQYNEIIRDKYIIQADFRKKIYKEIQKYIDIELKEISFRKNRTRK